MRARGRERESHAVIFHGRKNELKIQLIKFIFSLINFMTRCEFFDFNEKAKETAASNQIQLIVELNQFNKCAQI